MVNRLDFGSGHNPIDGYKTCDVVPRPFLDYLVRDNAIDCSDGMFDEIYCRNTIHHVKDIQPICDELFRVLRDDGILKIVECREEKYFANLILDNLWYRFINRNAEVFIAKKYRDYKKIFAKKFILIKETINNEKEITAWKKLKNN